MLACAACLVAIYVCQEFLEGLFATGHPAGLVGVFDYGGWWSVPAAVGVGLVIAAAFHGGSQSNDLARAAITAVPKLAAAGVTVACRRSSALRGESQYKLVCFGPAQHKVSDGQPPLVGCVDRGLSRASSTGCPTELAGRQRVSRPRRFVNAATWRQAMKRAAAPRRFALPQARIEASSCRAGWL